MFLFVNSSKTLRQLLSVPRNIHEIPPHTPLFFFFISCDNDIHCPKCSTSNTVVPRDRQSCCSSNPCVSTTIADHLDAGNREAAEARFFLYNTVLLPIMVKHHPKTLQWKGKTNGAKSTALYPRCVVSDIRDLYPDVSYKGNRAKE
jgi:hypothetical protein